MQQRETDVDTDDASAASLGAIVRTNRCNVRPTTGFDHRDGVNNGAVEQRLPERFVRFVFAPVPPHQVVDVPVLSRVRRACPGTSRFAGKGNPSVRYPDSTFTNISGKNVF